ncbi:hypothetical protein MXE27_03725 [Methanobacterium alcaliphilum]|nr:hypothetical protein [Methanobacterium alcaliphilum]MCK9151052.1 hypothetical protein [Methanobacterium alcaliphilum]
MSLACNITATHTLPDFRVIQVMIKTKCTINNNLSLDGLPGEHEKLHTIL